MVKGSRADAQVPRTEGDPDDDVLILSVKLGSGRFESSISVPLFATDEQRSQFVDQWLGLMDIALKISASKRERDADTTGK